MKPTDNIKNLVANLNDTTGDDLDQRTLNDVFAAMDNTKQHSAQTQSVWRIIMRSNITKLATAAIVIAAILVGINRFGGSIDGASVVWAQVVKNIEEINTYSYRQRQTDYSGVKPSGFEFTNEWKMIWYFSTEFGIRWDQYQIDELISQYYQMPKEQQIVHIMHISKTFSRSDHKMPETMQVDPRCHVKKIIGLPFQYMASFLNDNIIGYGKLRKILGSYERNE